MIRRSQRVALRSGLVFCLVLSVGLALVPGCAAPPGRRGVTAELDAATQREAATAYRRLLADPRYEDPTALREAGVEWLEAYAGARNEDHVLWLTGRAAAQTGNSTLVARLFDRLDRLHPDSEYRVESTHLRAVLAQDRGHWAEEADALVQFLAIAGADEPRVPVARQRIRALLEERLTTDEIDALWRAHPRSVIGSTAAWLTAQRRYEEAGPPEEVAARLENFLREYPQSRYVEDARALLARIGQEYGIDASRDLAVAQPDRIGLLAPLSGQYAGLGQSMFDAALLAVEEHNRATGQNLQLVGLDTRGDEVVAVQAARRLIEQENVIAIVGGLLSSTTVAVATLAEERGVPLISPTATKETIGDLGVYVFQTNLTKAVETAMVARAGVQALRRTRYGVLFPQGEQGAALSLQFAQEVERWGGEVVVELPFNPAATDFRTVIRELRKRAPEALYVPATPNVMRLIAPQLVFHDLRTQLLGPSSWGNSLLVREAGDSMQRAVFPSSVALISSADQENFDSLWSRRRPGTPSDPIGLKTYFATRRVIEALDPEAGTTRLRVRDRIEAGLLGGDTSGRGTGLERLSIIEGDQIVSFPAQIFPLARPTAAPADSNEVLPLYDLDDLLGGDIDSR